MIAAATYDVIETNAHNPDDALAGKAMWGVDRPVRAIVAVVSPPCFVVSREL
jgi:hypothetical protein